MWLNQTFQVMKYQKKICIALALSVCITIDLFKVLQSKIATLLSLQRFFFCFLFHKRFLWCLLFSLQKDFFQFAEYFFKIILALLFKITFSSLSNRLNHPYNKTTTTTTATTTTTTTKDWTKSCLIRIHKKWLLTLWYVQS